MSALALSPKHRRTQEERSATTRARLLDATIECLSELGYANTTTTEIAKRAGLSRGAQLHHFPTKIELVTTAVDHVFARRTEEFRAAFAHLPSGADRTAAAIELLWSMVSGQTFYAWLELVVAARTDADLEPAVSAMATRFADTVGVTFHELFPDPAARGPFFNIAPHFAFALLQGLALDRISVKNDPGLQVSLELLKTLASWAITPRT